MPLASPPIANSGRRVGGGSVTNATTPAIAARTSEQSATIRPWWPNRSATQPPASTPTAPQVRKTVTGALAAARSRP